MTKGSDDPAVRRVEQRPHREPVSEHARRLLAAAGALAALATPARAWTPQGHMATGALAYDDLERRDPAAVATILRLLPALPYRMQLDDALKGKTGSERDRLAFEWMARWPDDARSGPWSHPDWHYAEQVVSPWRAVLPFTFGKAVPQFARNLAVARDPHAPAAERAVAICWVMHIAGDMHQPLHAGMWMSWRFPLTDRGGTTAWVRASPTAESQTLHDFWDAAGAAKGDPLRRAPVLTLAVETGHPNPVAPAVADPAAAFAQWVAISRALALHVAYADGALKPGASPRTAPVLDRAYVQQVRTVSQARLAQAGYRIGALLAGLRAASP